MTPAAGFCIFLLAQKNTKKGRPAIITAIAGSALIKLLYYCGEIQRFPDVVPG